MASLLELALAAKSAAHGRRYTYRELSDDSGVDYSYVSKILRGRSRPSEAILEAWSKALDPHFPLDAALVAAGYTPASQDRRRLTKRIAEAPAQFISDIEREVDALLERLTNRDARKEHQDQQHSEKQPDADAPPSGNR